MNFHKVILANDKCHMFVAHILGVPTGWGETSKTAYYTSDDGLNSKFGKFAYLGGNKISNISMMQTPDKTWRLRFKDQANGRK